jgi:PAS domain S-box-containing protein
LKASSQFDQSQLLGLVHDAVIATDTNGTIHSWNAGAERLYGYSPAEVFGNNIRLVYFPEDLAGLPAEVANPVQSAARGRDLIDAMVRRRHRDGRSLLVSLRIAVIRDASGAIAGFITCSNDITQRKLAEDALVRAHAELEQRIEERTRDLWQTNARLEAEVAERRRVEAELRASRERLDHLLLRSPGVLYSSGVGNIRPTFVSQNAASVFGYPAGEFLDHPAFRMDHVHPDDRAQAQSFPAHVAREGQHSVDYRFLHGDGSWRYVRDSAVAVRDESGKPVEIVGYWLDVTEEKRAEEDRREQERLRFFAETLLTTQEAERKRVSRELHDDLNQRLATLILDAGILEQNLPSPPGEIRKRLTQLKRQAAGISDSVRAIALQLHSAGLEQFGLRAALEQECASLAQRTSVRIAFRSRRVPEAMPENVSLCLYRVAQECLRNVLRHSGARRAVVTLEGFNGSIRLRVKDDGAGFDVDRARGRKSLGLISMNERVRLIGGALTIDSRSSGGTLVEVRAPLSAPIPREVGK